MDDSRYRVIFKGRVVENRRIEEVKNNLANLLKLDVLKVEKLFSGGTKILKKNMSRDACEKTVAVFENAGAVCEIEKEVSIPLGNHGVEPPPLPTREAGFNRMGDQTPARQADEKFCVSCGRAIKLNLIICPYCGKRHEQYKMGCLPKIAIAFGVGFFILPVIGILAAIAIPNFISYRNKAYESAVRTELSSFMEKQKQYHLSYGVYSNDLETLEYSISNPEVELIIESANQTCYDANGKHSKYNKRIWVDCHGFGKVVQE